MGASTLAGESALKSAGKVAASATAAFTLSHMLQQLSGQALWMPSQLRVAVEVFTTLLGTIVFLRVQGRPRTKGAKRRGLSLAILWALGAVVFFVAYMWLRSACLISWDPAQWKTTNPEADFAALPDFVDPVEGQVYIPLVLPAELQDYLEELGRNPSASFGGLQWILLTEPDLLFDWLRGEARMQLWATSALFLFVHLAIISCVAVAAALAGARLKPDAA